MAFASTTLVLFSDNGLPRFVTGNAERYALFCVVRETGRDVVYRLDAHRTMLRNDTDVIGAECLAHVARQRNLSLAGDLGGLYNCAHALLYLVCFTVKHSTENAHGTTSKPACPDSCPTKLEPSDGMRAHDFEQGLSVTLEFFLSDSGHAAQRFARSRPQRGDGLERAVVEHHERRHAVLAGDAQTPGAQCTEQRRVGCGCAGLSCGGFPAALDTGGPCGLFAQHHAGLAFQHLAGARRELQRAERF